MVRKIEAREDIACFLLKTARLCLINNPDLFISIKNLLSMSAFFEVLKAYVC